MDAVDYRGFQQWTKIGRSVNKGQHSHASILAPVMFKGKRKYWENEHGSKHIIYGDQKAPEGRPVSEEEFKFIKGFAGIPVFGIDQTSGKEVEYKTLELPKLQYKEVADFLKIKVKAVSGNNEYYGCFSPSKKTIELATNELLGYTDPVTGQKVAGKIDLLNSQDRREAEALYGYTDPTTGKHVMGELEIQADRNSIERAGLSIEEAKTYGYTDESGKYHPGALDLERERVGIEQSNYEMQRLQLFGGIDIATGKMVEGTLSMKAKELGLQSDNLALQRNELFGYTDPKTGVFTPGKYQLMSEEQKRSTDEFYGYFDKGSGEYVPGKFEQSKFLLNLQGEMEVALKKAGYEWEVVMSQLQGMKGEQAAEVVKAIAAEVGINIPDMTSTTNQASTKALEDYITQRYYGGEYNLSVDQVEAIKNSTEENNLVEIGRAHV
jgi:hypothetical protein